jgi:hypothetical protein
VLLAQFGKGAQPNTQRAQTHGCHPHPVKKTCGVLGAMLALSVCAAVALVPRYSSGGPSRQSLATPSLRRSAVVRLALDPAGADPADTTTPEPAKQAWPEPAFSVAELQAKEEERIEAAEAATRAGAVPLTTEDGAFSSVALVTVCFPWKQGGSGFSQPGSPEAPFNARSCPGLPKASASPCLSAARAALAGHTGLVIDVRRWPSPSWLASPTLTPALTLP